MTCPFLLLLVSIACVLFVLLYIKNQAEGQLGGQHYITKKFAMSANSCTC